MQKDESVHYYMCIGITSSKSSAAGGLFAREGTTLLSDRRTIENKLWIRIRCRNSES